MFGVEPIPAFRDNYIWACHNGKHVVFVDPGDAGPILAWLADQRLKPVAILVTHHHADHLGGVSELLRHHPMPVYGPREAAPAVDHYLVGGERLNIHEIGAEFEVMAVPGHTLGHLAYLASGHLFCGDALFSCGCGRIFEGTPAMMHDSLSRLAGLPPDTRIHCAHEYTLANLAFASDVDPDNPQVQAWEEEARVLRRSGQPTLPVTLADELRRNPFLRCADADFRQRLEIRLGMSLPTTESAFASLRAAKDHY